MSTLKEVIQNYILQSCFLIDMVLIPQKTDKIQNNI